MNELLDDNTLMEKVKLGDKQSYDEIVIRHRKAAISFAYSFVQDVFAAEDIVQDCFVNIYISCQKYKSTFTFKTLLYTAVRNRSIDHLRRSRSHIVTDLESQYELAGSFSTEQNFLESDSIRQTLSMIDSLSADYKTATYLYCIEGLSYKEISAIMKKTPAQVKITLFRAREKLKKLRVMK